MERGAATSGAAALALPKPSVTALAAVWSAPVASVAPKVSAGALGVSPERSTSSDDDHPWAVGSGGSTGALGSGSVMVPPRVVAADYLFNGTGAWTGG